MRVLLGTPLFLLVLAILAGDYLLERAWADGWGLAPPVIWGFALLVVVVTTGAAAEMLGLLRRLGWQPNRVLGIGLPLLLLALAAFVGLWVAHGEVARTRAVLGPAPAESQLAEPDTPNTLGRTSEPHAVPAGAGADAGAGAGAEAFNAAYVGPWTLQRLLRVAPPILFAAWFAGILLIWIAALWSGPPGEAGHLVRIGNAVGTSFVFTLVGGAFALALLLRALPEVGFALALLGLLASRLGDAGAYFVGRLLGRHKLIANVSPKKTVEGTLGGLLTSALLAWLIGAWFPAVLVVLPLPWLLVTGALLGAAAQVADLLASALKRAAGVKDSSRLIPEFGGVVDLVDGFLFSLPMLAAILCAKPYVERLLAAVLG